MTPDKTPLLVNYQLNKQLFIKTFNIEHKNEQIYYTQTRTETQQARDKARDETSAIMYKIQDKDAMHKILDDARQDISIG